jgi:hypothetical protein
MVLRQLFVYGALIGLVACGGGGGGGGSSSAASLGTVSTPQNYTVPAAITTVPPQ